MYQANTVYHVYNQTNNFERLFRNEDNYHFFLEKIRTHLLPVADLLCYCLMPDHFHLMLRPTAAGLANSNSRKIQSARTNGVEAAYQQAISHALKIMLSSYVRAFNRRFNRRGSLLRSNTHAKPVYVEFMPPELLASRPLAGELAPHLMNCFHYIHQNPVKAELVDTATDWTWSSAQDYAGLRAGTLCNYELTHQLLGMQPPC